MRRTLLLIGVVMLVAVGLAGPATGAPGNGNGANWIEIPIVPEIDNFEDVNPCTGEVITVFFEGKLLIHEFERNNGYHANWIFDIASYTSDGFSSRGTEREVIVENVSRNVQTFSYNANHQMTNEAGSKYRGTYNEKWTVVDGEAVVERVDTDILTCIRNRG